MAFGQDCSATAGGAGGECRAPLAVSESPAGAWVAGPPLPDNPGAIGNSGPGAVASSGPRLVGVGFHYHPSVLARVPQLAMCAALTAVALVLAHNLSFLLTYGPVEGRLHGNDARWGMGTTVLALGGALLPPRPGGSGASPACMPWRPVAASRARSSGGLWPAPSSAGAVIGPLSAALLVVQENLEHALAGLPLPLLGVLYSAEYPVTVPVVGLVALAIATVAGLFALRMAALQARGQPSPDGASARPPLGVAWR